MDKKCSSDSRQSSCHCSVKIKNVSYKKDGSNILYNVSLTVNHGEMLALIGRNGSGKTTTIKMILRLIDSDSGEIKVNGFDTKKQFEKAMECIGAIVENPDMYKYMSGIDNLKLHARIRNIDEKRIAEVLEMVGLKDRAKDKVGKYSLGMKQRLGLALTLLHNPKVLILDEPTNGLDPAGIKQLRDILKKISHEENVAVFVSSHILTEMQQMCDRVAVLDNGKIVKIEQITNSEEEKIETIELRLKNKEKAIKILKEKFEVDAKVEKNNLLVTIQTERVPEVVKELAIEDVGVKAVIPREHNLERIFFDATEGGK